MSFPITFRCKIPKNPPAEVPLYFEVRPEGKNRSLPMGRRIPVKYLKGKGSAIDTDQRGAKRYESFVAKEKIRLEKVWQALREEGYAVTFDILKEYYTTGKEVKPVHVAQQEQRAKDTYFADFIAALIEKERTQREKHPDQGISKITARGYDTEVKRLRDYHPNLKFEDINGEWINHYYDYCLERGGYARNDENTRVPMEIGSMRRVRIFLRKYLTVAVEEGILAKNPIKDARSLNIRHKEREYLNIEEVKALQELYKSRKLLEVKGQAGRSRGTYGENLQTVLWYSLAACYTGLRYSDLAEFDPNQHVRQGRIVKLMVKGGKRKQVVIPLRKPMQELLDDVWKPGEAWTLKIPANNTFNRRVRVIAAKVGIEKHLTAHCFRHTFAIVSLMLGVRLETISDLLGHSSIQTTQIYARIVDEVRETQMDAWNELYDEQEVMLTVHCEGCSRKLIELPKDTIVLPAIPLHCKQCGHDQIYHTKTQPTIKAVA